MIKNKDISTESGYTLIGFVVLATILVGIFFMGMGILKLAPGNTRNHFHESRVCNTDN